MNADVRALRDLLQSLGIGPVAAQRLAAQLVPAADAERDRPVYTISAAAALAGMHPQTLRQYDRLGLVTPQRTKGQGRRYSRADIDRLAAVQRLSQRDGVNLAGVAQIMRLARANEQLQREVATLRRALAVLADRRNRVFAADAQGVVTAYAGYGRASSSGGKTAGQLVPRRSDATAIVVWQGYS